MKGYENRGRGWERREKRGKMRTDENEGKTEMGSAVNIGVNREAIGMNRSGMTLLPDLNLFESFFPVFRVPSFNEESNLAGI